MKLFIKVVCGKGYVIDVSEDITVLELKERLETAIYIPIAKQALLSLGKVLTNDKPLSYYPTIKDGSKLNLVVKKPEPIDVNLTRFLLKYYTEAESKIICEEFMKDYVQNFENISLEDLERTTAKYIVVKTEIGIEMEDESEDESEDEEEN